MPQYMFDELCSPYPNIMQLQRLLSQDWMRVWDRWIHIQDMADMYDKDDLRKWLCQHAVMDITSLSLMHVGVSCPSDEEHRLHLMHDGSIFGDVYGFDLNCFADGLLHVLLHHKCYNFQLLTSMFQNGNVKHVKL